MTITNDLSIARRLTQKAADRTGRFRLGERWRRFLSLLSGIHSLALVDQVVVSAASFLTTVIIGRFSGSSELGAYAIVISILASSFTIQGSLITLPYSIQRSRPFGTPAEHAGSSLLQSSILAAVITILLALTALILFSTGAQPAVTAVTCALAGIMPFALFREFCRRFDFIHLQMVHALVLDTVVSAVQLSLLGWLAWTDRLSAITACATIGISCGLVAVGWWILARAQFAFLLDDLKATSRQSWNLGKWLVANQALVQVQRYATYWLAMMTGGAAFTGTLAACMSIVAFANPLVFGLGNVLAPRSVLAWNEKGGAGLRLQTIRDALFLGALVGAFCLLVLLVGGDVMHFLYPGQEYEGHALTVSVLAFATLASAIAMPASNALASMERPYAIAVVNAAGTSVTVLLVWILMADWGLLGAAYGLLWGNLVSCVGLWIGFISVVPKPHESAPPASILRTLSQDFDPDRCTIARLGEGDHSNVYSVQSDDRKPVWREHQTVVVKLYKQEIATIALANAQFESLCRLHAELNGLTVNGWRISTPKPLHVCQSPIALLMTPIAEKKDLKTSAGADDDLTPEALQAMARATVTALLGRSWSRGHLHGDLALQNILYDVRARTLSFIDPGTEDCCSVCNDVGTSWGPAVLELGHIVRDLGTDVRDLIGNPAARLRRQIFVESALRTYLDALGSSDEKRGVLNEIRSSAHTHLSKVLEVSWSFHGLWRWILTKFAVGRMDSLLEKLGNELSTFEGPRAAADRAKPPVVSGDAPPAGLRESNKRESAI